MLVHDDIVKLRKIGFDRKKDFANARIEISYSSDRYLECNSEGVNKGKSIEWLSNYLNIDLSKIIAVGDNSNDASMLKAAGLGVAVANATKDAKMNADYIMEYRYDEMAVAKLIQMYF